MKSLKVARVVNLKLVFNCFYILVVLIKLCKIRYLNKVDLYYSQETRFFVWKIENFVELQLLQSLIFFAEISHMFST